MKKKPIDITKVMMISFALAEAERELAILRFMARGMTRCQAKDAFNRQKFARFLRKRLPS